MNSYVIRQEISSQLQLSVLSSELESLLTGSKLTFQNQLCVAFAGSKEFLPSSKTSNSVFFGKRVIVPDGQRNRQCFGIENMWARRFAFVSLPESSEV